MQSQTDVSFCSVLMNALNKFRKEIDQLFYDSIITETDHKNLCSLYNKVKDGIDVMLEVMKLDQKLLENSERKNQISKLNKLIQN